MMRNHDECLAELRKQLLPRTLWYIEVMAVRPSLHGQGLGRKLLETILDMCGTDPVVLECTDTKNIGFYQKFGFEELKPVILRDDKPNCSTTLSYCIMIRR